VRDPSGVGQAPLAAAVLGHVVHHGIVLEPGGGGQTMLVEAAPVADVKDPAARGDQGVGQHPPMASPPQRFRAHDCGGPVTGGGDEPEASIPEGLRLHMVGVPAEAGRPEGDVSGIGPRPTPAPEVPPPPLVGDAGSFQRRRQGVPAELRVLPRSGRRSDVDEPIDAGSPEEIEESIDVPGPVPDGEYSDWPVGEPSATAGGVILGELRPDRLGHTTMMARSSLTSSRLLR